jgi:hypothetical protein
MTVKYMALGWCPNEADESHGSNGAGGGRWGELTLVGHLLGQNFLLLIRNALDGLKSGGVLGHHRATLDELSLVGEAIGFRELSNLRLQRILRNAEQRVLDPGARLASAGDRVDWGSKKRTWPRHWS